MAAACLVAGCAPLFKEMKAADSTTTALHTESYKQHALRVSYDEPADADFEPHVERPRRLDPPRDEDLREFTLAEAVTTAMEDSAIIRQAGDFMAMGNTLLRNPSQIPSIFDVAIQESGGLQGGGGVDAALAEFDPQLTAGVSWISSEVMQNNQFLSGGVVPGSVLDDETAILNARLSKQWETGGLFSLTHDWNYSSNNVPSRLFPSIFTGFIRAEYRQPLMAGAGREFNSIAGPRRGGVNDTQVDRGVLIARISVDMSQAQFEQQMQDLVKNVEALYWELHLAFRVYRSEVEARDDAQQIWKRIKSRVDAGFPQHGAADEAYARQNYLQRERRVETALADLYETESRMRRLIGMPVAADELLHPVDAALSDEFPASWELALSEALTERIDLRRQRSSVRSLSLQLKAARSLLRPYVDFVSGFQLNGFGDNLADGDGRLETDFDSAYRSLLRADQTTWDVGVQLSIPLGYRRAKAQVRNAELRLAKAQSALAAQEMEISHELSVVFQRLDRWLASIITNREIREAAEQRTRAVEADYDVGRADLDLLLRSRIALYEAEQDYFRSIAAYNQAITEFEYRTGSILSRNNVQLADGPWEAEISEPAVEAPPPEPVDE